MRIERVPETEARGALLRQRVIGIPEEESDNPGQCEIEDEEKLSGNWI